MKWRDGGLFAGGGIQLPGLKVTLWTIVAAFAAGILIGWITTLVPGFLQATPPSPSPSPEPSPTIVPSVSVPPLAPINRELDASDTQAGITSLDYVYEADGTFTVVPGRSEPDPTGPLVEYVSIEVEDGIALDARVFADFVMERLNSERGWGAEGRRQFVQTDGVADFRILIASPFTAAKMCPNPHEVALDVAIVETVPTASPAASLTPSPSPSPSATASPAPATCAQRAITMISFYDWAAGLTSFQSEREHSRVYLLMHGLGHLMGLPEEECASGRATVMANQRDLPEGCETNPWPYPDAMDAEAPDVNE